MTLRVVPVAPRDALAALREAVHDLQGGRPLTAVTVVVPTNATGVAARRYLGRSGGIAAVDMLTLYRVAELVGGPALAAGGRIPVSAPVIDLTVRAVLAERPGPFAAVAEHPSTVVALRDLHRELRAAGPGAPNALAAASERGRDAAQVSARVTSKLAGRWYDEADLVGAAVAAIEAQRRPERLRRVVVFLPHPLHGVQARLVDALAAAGDVVVLAAVVGDDHADRELFDSLPGATVAAAHGPAARSATAVVSATDADEEVRHAVRAVWQAARDGVSLARIAVLWPADRPYARLVEHHLDLAGLPWNGRPGTGVAERVVPRLLLDLLDIDRRGLRRRDLFQLIADLPLRTSAGEPVPVARWERVSRDAGVTSEADWAPRLGSYARRQRLHSEAAGHDRSTRADDAEQLAAFVRDLRDELGPATGKRQWREWAGWSERQIVNRLGLAFLRRLPEPERVAWEHTSRVLDRLRCLDELAPPATRREFRAVFAAEFDVAPGRLGRIGNGVGIGSLGGAVGLDVDLAIVLGAAEGLMPPAPTAGPLVADSERAAAGLSSSEAAGLRLARQFRAVLDSVPNTLVTMPRGDLRTTATHRPTRWLAGTIPDAISSHHAALLATPFPAHEGEHRLRRHLAHAVAHGPFTPGDSRDDAALARSLVTRSARRSATITEFDGDLSAVAIAHFAQPVAPTHLEQWVACPHAYFVRHVLGVKPVEEPSDLFEIGAADRGNLLHAVLDRFHREVIDGTLDQPGDSGWSAAHWARLEELFTAVADEYELAGRTGRAAAWQVDRRNMRVDLAGWFERDSRRAGALGVTVLRSEERFGGDGSVTMPVGVDGRVMVHGQIDRIDRTADGTLVVTDHKTGRASGFVAITADDPTAHATKYQLPAYAAGAAALLAASGPVRAEYSFFGQGEYQRVGYVVDDAVRAQVAGALDWVVAGIESGLFVAIPAAPGYQPFVGCHYCQADGLGTEERYPEWERKRHDPRGARWFADDDSADDIAAQEAP